MSVKSRKRLRTAIDTVYKWAILTGRPDIKVIPTECFQSNRKEEEKLPEILNLDEIKLLLRVARDMKHHW